MSSLHKKIYETQDIILKAFSQLKSFPFVLSGGTALSRFYFHHRFSEDLDFFCEEIDFSFGKVEAIVNFLRNKVFQCEFAGKTDLPGRLKIASYSICKDQTAIKVDFLEDPFSGMWLPVERQTESGALFKVDALDQLYYRKFFSLLEQWHRIGKIQRIKDLIDLYVLHKNHRTIEKTIALFRKNHVPVDEEKIILIFAALKISEIHSGIKNLKCDIKADALWKELNLVAENLVQKGFGK